MAARRGKSQARRRSGNGGLPGWAWALIGLLVGVVLVLAVPRWLESRDASDGPQPDPDAQPVPVASSDGLVQPVEDAQEQEQEQQEPEYDFYTLLPGKEVRLSDAELAAREQAEAAAAKRETQTAQAKDEAAATSEPSLPQPVDTDASGSTATTRETPPATQSLPDPAPAAQPTQVAIDDGSRYLLQAGAYQSATQAEALKARIALLGLSAHIVPATIDGKLIHRVRLGPYDSAGALADAKRKLAKRGLPGMAIKVK